MKITVDRKRCSGCHLCELVCSLFHGGSVNPEKSAIRIKKDDLNTSMNMPILCRQCREMKCLPGKKAEGEREKKKFIWGKSRAERCPFGALPVFGNKAYHCDLCQGKPQCVKVCTTRAIGVR
jgi:Fe-S-cluster-containing hydrogenase component 2